MCIQQVPDGADPDQIVVVESFDIIVAPALVQPRVDVGDWSWSAVRLVVHKVPFAKDLGRRPAAPTFRIGTFSVRFGWRDVLILRWGGWRRQIAS